MKREHSPQGTADSLLKGLRTVTVDMIVRQEDFTLRQLAVLMLCCASERGETVGGLAQKLGVPGASISRAVDVLQETGMVRREYRWEDGRSHLIMATRSGTSFVRELGKIMSWVDAGRDKTDSK